MTIAITDNGKVRTYTVKEPHALTIADYRALESIEPGKDYRENLVEAFKLLTGIPKTHIRRMRPAELAKALDIIGESMAELAQAKSAADTEPTPTSFTHGGITYIVPQDIEADTIYGQWEDLHNVLIPQAGVSQADIHKVMIAAMCVPEGVEYNGAVVRASMEAFEDLPIRIALRIGAFFFEKSQRFRDDTSRSILRCLTLKQRKDGPGPISTLSDTEPTAVYSGQAS